MAVDFIIVGQGIAGTCLTHVLLESGASVLVIDKERPDTSSKIAAGLFNPVALKRLTKSWRAEEFFPFAKTFYTHLEENLGIDFYHPTPILKIFSTVAEQNDWLAKSSTKVLGQFMSKEVVELQNPFLAPFGAGQVLHCGWLDTPAFLTASRNFFRQEAQVLNEEFEHNRLEFAEGSVRYKTNHASHIIFCEGYAVQDNPLFKWLPFTPNKGEVLSIKSNDLHVNEIYNKKCFLLPQQQGVYKIGSTYNWRSPNSGTSKEGQEELAAKLADMVEIKYSVINHQSGIRPAVKDRKPIIGQHPEQKRAFIFNGMGSKGVTMAPFFANQLVGYLFEKKQLDAEVSIDRFAKLI